MTNTEGVAIMEIRIGLIVISKLSGTHYYVIQVLPDKVLLVEIPTGTRFWVSKDDLRHQFALNGQTGKEGNP